MSTASCSHYQEQSCLTWQLCSLCPLCPYGTGSKRDSSSFLIPWVICNHVADATITSSHCFRVVIEKSPLSKHGAVPRLFFNSKCAWTGSSPYSLGSLSVFWGDQLKNRRFTPSSELYHMLLSFMEPSPVKMTRKKGGNKQEPYFLDLLLCDSHQPQISQISLTNLQRPEKTACSSPRSM